MFFCGSGRVFVGEEFADERAGEDEGAADELTDGEGFAEEDDAGEGVFDGDEGDAPDEDYGDEGEVGGQATPAGFKVERGVFQGCSSRG